MLDNLANFRKI